MVFVVDVCRVQPAVTDMLLQSVPRCLHASCQVTSIVWNLSFDPLHSSTSEDPPAIDLKLSQSPLRPDLLDSSHNREYYQQPESHDLASGYLWLRRPHVEQWRHVVVRGSGSVASGQKEPGYRQVKPTEGFSET